MLALHPEYVINEHHETKAVLLPFTEWQHVLEMLEDIEDIEHYDRIKSQPLEYIPFDHVLQGIQG